MAKYGLKGGYNRKEDNDFAKVRDEMLGLNDVTAREAMFCSEFVARCTAATFEELNDRIAGELSKAGIEHEKEVIKNPIPKKHSLKKIHPKRLVELLNQADCISKVESPVLSNLVRQQDTSKSKSAELNSSKRLFERMNVLAQETNSQEEFVEKGKKVFSAYIKAENIASEQISEEEMLQQLDKPLHELYKSYNPKKPETFVEKFKKTLKTFGEWLGLKDKKAQKIVDATLKLMTTEKDTTKEQAPITKPGKWANRVARQQQIARHQRGGR